MARLLAADFFEDLDDVGAAVTSQAPCHGNLQDVLERTTRCFGLGSFDEVFISVGPVQPSEPHASAPGGGGGAAVPPLMLIERFAVVAPKSTPEDAIGPCRMRMNEVDASAVGMLWRTDGGILFRPGQGLRAYLFPYSALTRVHVVGDTAVASLAGEPPCRLAWTLPPGAEALVRAKKLVGERQLPLAALTASPDKRGITAHSAHDVDTVHTKSAASVVWPPTRPASTNDRRPARKPLERRYFNSHAQESATAHDLLLREPPFQQRLCEAQARLQRDVAAALAAFHATRRALLAEALAQGGPIGEAVDVSDAGASNEPENMDCPLCYAMPTDRTLQPCGHKLCGTCAERVVKTMSRCPWCRGEIVSLNSIKERQGPVGVGL